MDQVVVITKAGAALTTEALDSNLMNCFEIREKKTVRWLVSPTLENPQIMVPLTEVSGVLIKRNSNIAIPQLKVNPSPTVH